MGLWALTRACVQGLMREHWGEKVEQPDGNLKDTGVQPFVDELVARLSSQDPIQMPGSLELIAPANAPAITIINNVHGDRGDGGDGGIVIENSITNENITINFNEITFTNSDGDTVSGFDGSITFPTSFSVSVVGCTVTISIAATQTLTFKNGILTGAG